MVETLSRAQKRKRERAERRTQILEAARQVFGELGIAVATMDQVAKAADISKGTLYLYFKSKDELFMELASEVIEPCLLRFESLSQDQEIEGRALFRMLVEAWVEVALSEPNTIRNAFVWLASGQEVDTSTDGFRSYRRRVEEIHRYMVNALERGRGDGSIAKAVDPVTMAFRVWGCLMGTLVLRINAAEFERRIPQAIDRENIVPGAIQLVFDGLAAQAAGGGDE